MKQTVSRKTAKQMERARRILAAFLSVCMLVPALSVLTPGPKVYAARIMRLSTAKSVAVARSEKIEALEIQIQSKQAAKESAIRAIREKERNMSTFRWSPLLDFNFPTEPDEAEAFEFRYKPTQLQYDIDTLNHKITDQKLKEYQDVCSIYMDIISSQSEVTFLKQRIRSLETTILKNKARLAEGTVSQDMIDQQQDKLDGLNDKLASEETTLQRAKEKLSDKLGFSVTTGYNFEEAFTSTNIDRDNIEYLQNYAKERDQTVYEAKQAEELARLALMTNFELMRSQYGANIGMISTYVQQALDGSSISKRSFKKDYDAFLKKIDDPWTGKKRILFFSLPKEWWKGDIDGIRYVEDDPYVLYQAALDYESALKEYSNTVKELNTAISDGYDNYIETRKAYITAQKNLHVLQEKLIYDEALNALGQLSLEEYDTELEEYENARSALKDALVLYTNTLYEYDRTTCGGASAYFTEEELSTQTGYAGLANSKDNGGIDDDLAQMNAVVEKGAVYSIRPIVDSQEFMLYLDIPENFDVAITHFELWSDGRQIGQRVAVGESIRHLKLTVQDVDSVFVRLYNGETFVDDCTIDPNVNFGPLNITTGYILPDQDDNLKPIGTYTVEDDTNTEMIKIRFAFDDKQVEQAFSLGTRVQYYNLSAERNLYLFSNDLIDAETPFTYMSFIKNDLGKLTVRMFSEDGNYIGGAYMDADTKKLYADTEITLADMQDMAARQLIAERKAAEITQEISRLKDLLNAAVSINTGGADTATEEYYRNRIAELEERLTAVADEVTAEEIREALINDADEIDKRVREMEAATQKDKDLEEGKEEVTDEETAARSQILKDAAIELVRQIRAEESKQQLENTIINKEREIAQKLRERKLALERGDEEAAAKLLEEMQSLQKEVDVAKAKLVVVDSDESEITEADLEYVLREYGDLVYANAEEKLSDAMLWGSEAGQWAKAYLEANGLPVDAESMRAVVKQAQGFREYEYMQARQETMRQELERAREKAEKYSGSDSVTEQNLSEQLRKMSEAYEKELETLRVDLKKKDPGKEVKIKKLKAEMKPLQEELAQLQEERAGLVSVITPMLGEFKKEETAEYTAAFTYLTALEQNYQNTMKTLTEEIAWYENYLLSEESVKLQYDQEIENAENMLKAAQDEYNRRMSDEDYQDVDDDRWFTYFWSSRSTIKNKISQMRYDISNWQIRVNNLNTEFERFTTQEKTEQYYDKLKNEISTRKEQKKQTEEQYKLDLPPAQERVDEAAKKVAEKEAEWNLSEERRKEIDVRIAELKTQIDIIQKDINEYY